MNRIQFKTALFALVAVTLVALPATAQVIPAGKDNWRTPGDGNTFFTFPAGDVESLCGAPPSGAWDHQVTLQGVPVSGADWDTQVTRLKDADLSNGSATVPIQVTHLQFRSVGSQPTPCGKLVWDVRPFGRQPLTKMTIKRNNDLGGIFVATIAVRVVFTGTADDGAVVGRLVYTVELPDPDGSPWSFGGPTVWRPGITEDDECIETLREKLTTLPARHAYFIEDLIAQGRCKGQPG